MDNFKLNNAKQQGSVILESLIGILIFSIGIFALIGLQAQTIKLSTDAKYRTDAALLANRVISEMWMADKTSLEDEYEGADGTGGDAYVNWLTEVQSNQSGLPGTAEVPPIITVEDGNLVTVTVRWRNPTEEAGTFHQYVAVAQINNT